MKKMLLYACLLCCLGLPGLRAQTAIGAASGEAKIGTQWHAYSIGEMCAVSTLSTGSLIITQGFLQPWDISLGLEEALFRQLKVWPNPSTSLLSIAGEMPGSGANIQLGLIDILGRCIQSQALAGPVFQCTFDLDELPAGTYFLKVGSGHFFKTYSILKL